VPILGGEKFLGGAAQALAIATAALGALLL
jgi:hypothetical protein